MCNAWQHPDSCECGFGPPYPGTIQHIESVEWIDEAANDEEAFKRALRDLNFDPATFRTFTREYGSIRTLGDPETIKDKLKRLVGRLEYREEEARLVPIKVPLFKLHSPFVRGARVKYRESDEHKERGWFVKVFGIGMGSTNTYQVVYEKSYDSTNGECLQVYVPLVLRVKSMAVYKSGVFQSRGIRAEIEGLEDERTLRKRGCDSLPKDECADRSALGQFETVRYALSQQTKSQKQTFTRVSRVDVARTIQLHLVRVFGQSIQPIAQIQHRRQLELEFQLPGRHDYSLSFSSGGLHWEVV